MYYHLSSFLTEYHQPWNPKANFRMYACITIEEQLKLSFEEIQKLSIELPYSNVENLVFT